LLANCAFFFITSRFFETMRQSEKAYVEGICDSFKLGAPILLFNGGAFNGTQRS
jgi:hypothetical protein